MNNIKLNIRRSFTASNKATFYAMTRDFLNKIQSSLKCDFC